MILYFFELEIHTTTKTQSIRSKKINHTTNNHTIKNRFMVLPNEGLFLFKNYTSYQK